MPLPGAEVNILDTAAPTGIAVDTGLTHALGETQKGPLEPTEIHSYGELVAIYGPRQTYGVLHDTLETAFRTGLSRATVTRVVADTATVATIELDDSDGDPVIVLSAPNPGAWANGSTGGFEADVIVNSTNRQIVLKYNDVEIERSPLTTLAGLLEWEPTSGVVVAAGSSTDPLVAVTAANFAGGNDDRGTINTADYQAALDRLTTEHGTGQLVAPGAAGHTNEPDIHHALLEKASDPLCQRFAVLDIDPAADAATAISKATALRNSGNGRWGTIVHPRVQVRAQGTTKLVPASGFWCGRAAFTDFEAGVGQPPAGQRYGEHSAILDVEKAFTDTERDSLNNAGVIAVARIYGAPRIYGAVTLARPTVGSDEAYRWVQGTRAVIRVRALAQQTIERYVLRRIDGPRTILVDLSNDLTAMLDAEHGAGNLYGNTPQEAYLVDTSYPAINSAESLANGMLRAAGEIRVVPVAERVQFDVAVRASGDQISTLA